MRITICLPMLCLGGTEMQTLTLTRTLLSAGHVVSVICYYEYDETVVKLFTAAGADVHILNSRRMQGLLPLFFRLVQVLREHKPHQVHVQYVSPGLVPILAARVSRVRVVFATVHQAGDEYGFKPKLLIRAASQLCDLFFCVSCSAERSWFGSSRMFAATGPIKGRRHYTLYNAVDVARLNSSTDPVAAATLRTSLGLGSEPTLGIVARLRTEKGHLTLLRALPAILKVFPRVRVICVGDGPDREFLLAEAERLGISANLLWLGSQMPEVVQQLYAVMDIVVVPSRTEGFGLTAVEAMAAGCPVVCSSVPALTEIIEHQVTGVTFPPNDCEALASAIVSLLGDSGKRETLRKNAQTAAAARFSLSVYGELVRSACQSFRRERNGFLC